jgi:shikimate dehydrogenase
MKKAGLIGNSIQYSLSPSIFSQWFKEYDIKGEYNLFDIEEKDLKATIYELRDKGYVGCNITVPFKKWVVQYCDDFIGDIQAVNMITFQNGRIIGENSDTFGFDESIYKNTKKTKFEFIFMFGKGGVSKAIQNSKTWKQSEKKLIKLNTRRDEIYTMDYAFLKKADLIINATPLGSKGCDDLNVDFSNIKKDAVVFDVVYNPPMTKFLQEAQNNGNQIINGMDMLIFQASVGFDKWFNNKN